MKKFFVLLFGLIILILIGGCQNLVNILPFLNGVPVIISEPIITAKEDQLYSYQVEASDPDGDNLNYSLIIKPEGMSINTEKNGRITWMPTNNQVGIHQVIVEISDGKYKVQQIFEIEVINVNNPPQILSYFPVNLNIEINEGDSVKFEVQGTDVDLNTTLDYRWFLEGGLISNSSGIGSASKSTWKYFSEYGDCGVKTVKVLVSDGEFEDSVQWKITIKDITPPNQPILNNVISPTNVSLQILTGTKEANSSIWINGTKAVPLNSSTDWSYSFELIEGENNLSITSRDISGNESTAVIANIILDTVLPEVLTLNIVTSPTNISFQTLSGTKETNTAIWINGAEVISINSDTIWSYSYNLSEGTNKISISLLDAASNESSTVTAIIEYDPNTYVDAGNASGTEDGTKTHPFNTIAEGIVTVPPGKSVIVAAGTYNEKLIINKGIVLQGAGKESTFISGLGYAGNLITIEADNVTISGFTIDGKSDTDIGIYSNSYSSIEISENLIQSQQDSGIFYQRISDDYSSGIYVYNNEICFNLKNGIKVIEAGSGIVESNSIRKNNYGILVCNSASLEVKQNNIFNNYDSGIFCQGNSSLLIWGNEITINTYGIRVGAQSSDTTNPDIGGGAQYGIGQNKIAGNTSNGVRNITNHNIFAKYNWWGDAAGPKYPGNNSSSGDWAYWSATGGDIDFYPWLSADP
jgi:parallel beta-helix repeat protein